MKRAEILKSGMYYFVQLIGESGKNGARLKPLVWVCIARSLYWCAVCCLFILHGQCMHAPHTNFTGSPGMGPLSLGPKKKKTIQTWLRILRVLVAVRLPLRTLIKAPLSRWPNTTEYKLEPPKTTQLAHPLALFAIHISSGFC